MSIIFYILFSNGFNPKSMTGKKSTSTTYRPYQEKLVTIVRGVNYVDGSLCGVENLGKKNTNAISLGSARETDCQ